MAGAGLASLGEQTCGLWTYRQALTVTTKGSIQARLQSGEWRRVWPGVFTDAGHVLNAEQRAVAAVLATESAAPRRTRGRQHYLLTAVATGRTAARVLDLPLIDDDDPATGARDELHEDVLVSRELRDLTHPREDGEIGHLHRHRRRTGPGDLARRPSGLWITSPERTLWECSRLLTGEALVCLLDAALHRGLVNRADLDQLVRDRSWCSGVAALRRAVSLCDGRAESPAETLARLLLQPHLPGLVPQVRAYDEHGRVVARYDLADEQLKLAVEADGRRGHVGDRMAARDNARDRAGHRRGWRTERLTWWDVRRGQQALIRRVVDAAEQQARRGSDRPSVHQSSADPKMMF